MSTKFLFIIVLYRYYDDGIVFEVGIEHHLFIFLNLMHMKLLIIDDEKDICMLLKNFFTKRGITVFTANTLIDGLKIIDDEEPDILFIDNMLPDGEGWKAAQTVKLKYPQININLMSAKDKSFNALDGYDEEIWEKPISVSQLERYLQFLNKNIQINS
jgi:two-component system OmpR family response regulator